MVFEEGHLYHLFNQGNNREQIFYSRENYLYFLTKIREHILPHADILAWCLMPNHFHLMIYVHTVKVVSNSNFNSADDLKSSAESETEKSSAELNSPKSSAELKKGRMLTDSIAIMLRSYTRAINIQEKRSGSLFRSHTKAECITKADGITPSFFKTSFGSRINVSIPEKEYPQVCFNYIHMNPVKAGLVKKPEDWEFSSCMDYMSKRAGKLVNKKRAAEFVSCSTT